MLNGNDRNKLIFNYLVNDKTDSAILISGAWGVGKTFYVRHKLIPYLESNNKKVVYVSAYGVKDIESLSKYILTESKFKKFNSKAGTIGVGIAKTVIRGITSYFNVDINGGTKEWKKLINSVKFKDQLLIIDDLERLSPDFSIIELLGYINNLCEQDGVKVLLICDEQALLSFCLNDRERDKYKRIKEKTIGDTIYFFPDFADALSAILDNFGLNILINRKDELLSEINKMANNGETNLHNLRVISRACQKTADIFARKDNLRINGEFDPFFGDFMKDIFISFVSTYATLAKNSAAFDEKKTIDKTSNIDKTSDLACFSNNQQAIPSGSRLQIFARNYCIVQKISDEDIRAAFDNYKESKDLEKSNKSVSIIKNYYVQDDKNLEAALRLFHESLNKELIPCSQFVDLSVYLIAIKHRLDYKYVDDILQTMLEIAKKSDCSNDIEHSLRDYSPMEINFSKDERLTFSQFLNDLKNAFSSKRDALLNGNQKISKDTLTSCIELIRQNKDEWLVSKRGYSSYFSFSKFADYIKSNDCSAKEINEIRGVFFALYRDTCNAPHYCFNDLKQLKDLKQTMDDYLSSNRIVGKSKALQVKWFSENLEAMIKNFGEGSGNNGPI